MGEISLILGTLFSQLSIGVFITGFLLGFVLKKVDEKTSFRTALVSFVIGFVGLVAITTHLGHPLLAFNALFNVGRSWLSREVVTYGGFLGFCFLYVIAQKLNKTQALKPLGIIATVFGIAAVIATSLIYTIPSIPAWDSANTPISFALTSIMLGVSLAFFLCGAYGDSKLGGAMVVGLASFLALVGTAIYVTSLNAGVPAASGSAYLMMNSAMFWLRLVILAAVAVISGVVIAKKGEVKMFTPSLFGVFFALLVVSEFMGRVLFFGTIVRF